jgi:hypothetical protein
MISAHPVSVVRPSLIVTNPMPRPNDFVHRHVERGYIIGAVLRIAPRATERPGCCPIFFIGAHAVIADARLITRDAARYRSYFPGIMLVAPN